MTVGEEFSAYPTLRKFLNQKEFIAAIEFVTDCKKDRVEVIEFANMISKLTRERAVREPEFRNIEFRNGIIADYLQLFDDVVI